MMRSALAWFVVLEGCSQAPDGTEPPPPDPKGWTLAVDLSGLDRFVQPAAATSWMVGGTVIASEGLANVAVAGMDLGATSPFAAMVPVMPGLTRVPVLASDLAGHARKGDRTLLATRLLPDGAHDPLAASLVLDNATLAAMSGGLAGQAGTIDVAGEILSRPVLSQDDRCTTWPTAASQDAVTVELVQDSGDLWLHVQVPNLDVQFAGECQGVLQTIPLAGEMAGTIDIWSQLAPKPTAGAPCLTAFAHTAPEVSVLGWQFDVWGTGGPLQAWIVSLFRDQKSQEAREQLASETGARADMLLADKLAHISVFDTTSQLDLLGRPVALHLCLADLNKTGTKLVARVAAVASGAGAGPHTAPGAPQVDGAAPSIAAHELLLDANLVGDLLYAAWRDGGLVRPGPDVDIGALEALIPGLYDRHPNATSAQVTIDAELPPLVRAGSGDTDLTVELGDVMVDVCVEGERILRFGVLLSLSLSLEPQSGKLVPHVVDATAQVALLDELLDGPDDALEQAVQLQLGSAAASLLGDGAAIALPALPGLGPPTDVVPASGGRFVRVKL
jgi:hypothetical protein